MLFGADSGGPKDPCIRWDAYGHHLVNMFQWS